MATIRLNWTPGGGLGTYEQLVYRKSGVDSYVLIATLSDSATTYDDTTAVINTLYTYKITNSCVEDETSDSTEVLADKLVCPSLLAVATGNAITLTLGALTGDVEYSDIKVYNHLGVLVDQGSGSGQISQTVVFSDLDYNSYYSFAIKITDGTFFKWCTVSTTTEAD